MVDMYKHLNKAKDFKIELDMEQVANMVCGCNYGFHRFISAVINRYENSDSKNERMIIGRKFKALVDSENIDVKYVSDRLDYSNPVVYMKVRRIHPRLDK